MGLAAVPVVDTGRPVSPGGVSALQGVRGSVIGRLRPGPGLEARGVGETVGGYPPSFRGPSGRSGYLSVDSSWR